MPSEIPVGTDPAKNSLCCRTRKFIKDRSLPNGVDTFPVTIHTIPNQRQRLFVAFRFKQMSEATLWFHVFFDGVKAVRDISVSHISVDSFLQWPETSFDSQLRELIAKSRVVAPAGRAHGQRQKQFRAVMTRCTVDFFRS